MRQGWASENGKDSKLWFENEERRERRKSRREVDRWSKKVYFML
jgi:hypothetical protein